MKFSAVLVFAALWFTFSYLPIAHMVWFWVARRLHGAESSMRSAKPAHLAVGALDFAGGTVVHINAGIAGLVGAFVLGKRIGYGRNAMPPHNLPMTMIGASLLWVGWFGFNAGSNLEANGGARWRSSTPSSPPQLRRWPGCSASGCCAASPPCWVSPPARWRAWWRSRRQPAWSARWARSSSARSPAWSACGA